MVTGVTSRERHGRGDEITFVTFALTDEQGARVVCQRKLLIQESHIPPPGTVVPIAYLPGRIEGTLDLVRSELDVPRDELWEPPDPSVPRGWSGGVFEVEPLGAEGAFPLSGHGIEEDRELFRTGRQAAAELIRSKAGRWLERPKAFPRTLTLRVEDREIDVVRRGPRERLATTVGTDDRSPERRRITRGARYRRAVDGLPGRR